MDIVGFVKANWLAILAIITALNVFLKAVRDAIDSTPATDDNFFEKLVTFLGKITGNLLLGKRE